MGLRFRKTLKIFSGLKLNFSGSGVSLTVGGRGHSVTYSKKGTYVNLGIPGTGISYRKKVSGGSSAKKSGASSGSGRVRAYRQSPYQGSATLTPAYPQPAYSGGKIPDVDLRMVRAIAEEVVTLPAVSLEFVQRRCQVQHTKAVEIIVILEEMGVISHVREDGTAEVRVRTAGELAEVWRAYFSPPVSSAKPDVTAIPPTPDVNSFSSASGCVLDSKGCQFASCLVVAIIAILLLTYVLCLIS
ncbi:MAG: DUF4236 domain-containing protein [Marinilabiliaceae bacterium]